jgi:hypothetical protein
VPAPAREDSHAGCLGEVSAGLHGHRECRSARAARLTHREGATRPKIDEDPILNPLVRWETVHLGEVAVLVDAANGFQHLERAQFPTFVRADDTRARSTDGVGWRTPFNVWTVGNEPVALVEQYVP